MQKKIVHLKFQGTFLHSSGQYSGISSSFSVSLNFRVKSTSLHSAKIYRDSKSYLKPLNWNSVNAFRYRAVERPNLPKTGVGGDGPLVPSVFSKVRTF